jgi:hypothetical protein
MIGFVKIKQQKETEKPNKQNSVFCLTVFSTLLPTLLALLLRRKNKEILLGKLVGSATLPTSLRREEKNLLPLLQGSFIVLNKVLALQQRKQVKKGFIVLK